MVRYKAGARDAVSLRDPLSEIGRPVDVLSANDWSAHLASHLNHPRGLLFRNSSNSSADSW
jgi:hypothetical protein